MNTTTTLNLRDMRLDLDDMRMWLDLIEFHRVEDETRVPADKMLERRQQAVNDGKNLFGHVLESGEKIVGAVMYHDDDELLAQGKPIHCLVMVDPEFRGHGCGRQLYESGLEQLRELGFDRCLGYVREGNTEGLAFADSLGCNEFNRFYKLTLNLSTLPDEELEPTIDETTQIFSLAQLRETDPHWMEKLHELSLTFMKDLPSRVEMADIFPGNTDDFEKLLGASEWDISLDGSYVAVVEGAWAATAWVTQAVPDSDWCFHLMTGVRPEHRRRGLVKVIKHAGFAWARASGIRYIHTIQQESNMPMLTLNRNLGFEIMNCYIALEHQF